MARKALSFFALVHSCQTLVLQLSGGVCSCLLSHAPQCDDLQSISFNHCFTIYPVGLIAMVATSLPSQLATFAPRDDHFFGPGYSSSLSSGWPASLLIAAFLFHWNGRAATDVADSFLVALREGRNHPGRAAVDA